MEYSEYYPIAFAIDAFLEAARRAQNAIWLYLNKVLSVEVPMSLADLVANIRKGKPLLPKRISELVESYWTRSGERLKQYRDLSQHHAVVSSDGRVAFVPDGRVFVYVVLPNNPVEKSPAKLSYLDPRIDTLPYALQAYHELHLFVLELVHLLLSYTTDPGLMIVGWYFKEPLRMQANIDGHEITTVQGILTAMKASIGELERRLDAELPRSEIVPTLIVPREDGSHPPASATG